MRDNINPTGQVSNLNRSMGLCRNSAGMNKALYQKMFEQEKETRYNKIYAHEMKHKNAGATGSIVIERDSDGMPTEGHVDVQMPNCVNKANPRETLDMAKIAYQSAVAPGGDMSDADEGVASRASQMMSLAQAEMDNNHKPDTQKCSPKKDEPGDQLCYFA
jgi:hypothetical protein